MDRELKPEDVGMDPDLVERSRKYYKQKEIEESERCKKLLRKSGTVGRLFVSKLDELGANIESLEPPNSRGRYNHVRVKFRKAEEEYFVWFQARKKDNFTLKYIKPLEDTLEAHIKHNLTPGDYVVVRLPLGGIAHHKSVKTMTEAFDKLIEMIETI